MITAYHMIRRDGTWYSKYLAPDLAIDRLTDFDTCNLVYTTSHDKLWEAKSYKPSMQKFNARQEV